MNSLALLPRPLDDQNKPIVGTAGKPVRLEANTFQIRLKPPTNHRYFYKYFVNVVVKVYPRNGATEVTGNGNSDRKPPLPAKNELRMAWAEMMADPTSRDKFSGIIPAFDGRSACFTAKPLPDDIHIEVKLPGPRPRTLIITIINGIELDLSKLTAWYQGTSQEDDVSIVSDILSALNIIFLHGMGQAGYPHTKTTFFLNEPSRLSLDARHRPCPLPRGVELWRGFFTSVRPASGMLYLNVDTTTGAFIKPGNMMGFVETFLKDGGYRGPLQADKIPSHERILINRILKKAIINVNLGNQTVPRYNIVIKKDAITLKSARDASFDVNGVMTTVEQYILSNFNIHLQNPLAPCVEVRPRVLYPLELCDLIPGNRFLKKLDSVQQGQSTSFQVLKPSDRLKAIREIARSLPIQNAPYLQEFFIATNPKGMEPMKLHGRILPPPTIEFGGGRADVRAGAWNMNRGVHRFIQPTSIPSAITIVNDARSQSNVVQFIQAMFRGLEALGMNTSAVAQKPLVFARKYGQRVEQAMDEAIQEAGYTFGKAPAVILWVFERPNDSDYNTFKAYGCRMGYPTQAIQAKNIRKVNDFQLFVNLGGKLNAKLGGINFSHVIGGQSWHHQNKSISFGADITHIDGMPSIAAIVASTDDHNMTFIDEISVQRLVEPSPTAPPNARAKRDERITEITSMVTNLLQRSTEIRRALPPPNVIFYRDGVSESEWGRIMQYEISGTQQGFENFRTSRPEFNHWNAKLTFILSVKGHHIRFFGDSKNAGSTEGKSGNVPAGVVVDTMVTDPKAFDFYLAAHAGILGTTRPTRYVVMVDEQNLSPDDLQSMVSSSCHSYQRCNRAVSIPAPIYYADLIAFKARAWVPLSSSGSSAGGSSSGDKSSRNHDFEHYSDIISGMSRASGGRRGMWWC